MGFCASLCLWTPGQGGRRPNPQSHNKWGPEHDGNGDFGGALDWGHIDPTEVTLPIEVESEFETNVTPPATLPATIAQTSDNGEGESVRCSAAAKRSASISL